MLRILIVFLLFTSTLSNTRAGDIITYKSDSLTILGFGQLLSYDYADKDESFFTLGKTGYVYKWDVNTGGREIIYGDFKNNYNKLAVSNDGRRAIIREDENKILVFDTQNNEKLAEMKSTKQFQALDIDNEGRIIAYAVSDIVTIYVLDNEKRYYFPFFPDWDVKTLKFAYDSELLIVSMTSVNQTKIVVIGNTEGKWTILSEYVYANVVNVKIRKDDSCFGVSYLNKIDIISLIDFKIEKTIETNLKEISDFDFIENGTRIIYSAMWDSSVFIADYDSDEHFKTAIRGENLKLINTSPDEAIFIENGNDIRLSNIYDGSLRHTIEGHTQGIRTLSIMDDESKILTDFGGFMSIIDYKNGIIDHKFDTSPLMVGQSKDGNIIVSSGKQCIRLYDGNDYHFLKDLCGHSDLVKSFSFSPDNRYIASASNEIFIWDLHTFEKVRSIYPQKSLISSVVYHPVFENIYESSYRMVRAWDYKTGDLYAESEEMVNSDWIQTLAFSEDGMVLTAAARSGELLFLNDKTLDIIGSFPTPTHSPLLDISFNKNSLYIIVSDEKGKLAIFSRLNIGYNDTINTYKNDKIWRARISNDNKDIICTHESGMIYIFNTEYYLTNLEADLTQKPDLTIFPNPLKDELYLSYPSEDWTDPRIEIFDNIGRKIAVFEDAYKQTDNRIYINFKDYNLTNGVYFIVVNQGDKFRKGSFVIYK